ncbi:MAG: hypothetical protein AB7V50_07800 [Vampirovibrionia bacterium]
MNPVMYRPIMPPNGNVLSGPINYTNILPIPVSTQPLMPQLVSYPPVMQNNLLSNRAYITDIQAAEAIESKGDLVNSEKAFLNVLSGLLNNSADNKDKIMYTYTKLGDFYLRNFYYDQAIKMYDSAIDNYCLVDSGHSIANISDKKGDAYVGLNKFDKAIESYDRSAHQITFSPERKAGINKKINELKKLINSH